MTAAVFLLATSVYVGFVLKDDCQDAGGAFDAKGAKCLVAKPYVPPFERSGTFLLWASVLAVGTLPAGAAFWAVGKALGVKKRADTT